MKGIAVQETIEDVNKGAEGEEEPERGKKEKDTILYTPR